MMNNYMAQQRNTAGVTGLTLALVAWALLIIPFFNVLSFLAWAVGLVFCLVGLSHRPRVAAGWGLGLCVAGPVAFLVFFGTLLGSLFGVFNSTSAIAPATTLATSETVPAVEPTTIIPTPQAAATSAPTQAYQQCLASVPGNPEGIYNCNRRFYGASNASPWYHACMTDNPGEPGHCSLIPAENDHGCAKYTHWLVMGPDSAGICSPDTGLSPAQQGEPAPVTDAEGCAKGFHWVDSGHPGNTGWCLRNGTS